MKKVLLIGAGGMLGGELEEKLEKTYDVVSTTRDILDICDKNVLISKVKEVRPYFIINCAAYTNVDGCELNVELANNVNGIALENIAEAANEVDATVIHISTDYVFKGDLDVSKCYTEEMVPEPVSAYGKSKLLGEQNILKTPKYYILRTAWLYGIRGKNFVKTMLRLSQEKDVVTVVNDQYGSPTSTKTLCQIIEQIMEKEPEYGIYHATCEGFTTWYDFTCKIFEYANIKTPIKPVTSEEFPSLTKRPTNSQLSKEKLHNIGIYPERYEVALKEFLNEEQNRLFNIKNG